jgi:Ca-activated chloride channel family protein
LLSPAVCAQDTGPPKIEESSKPIAYGLVVDVTGSLRPKFNDVVETARFVLKGNQPTDEVFVSKFTGIGQTALVQDFTSQSTVLSQALDAMQIEEGMSAIIDAVYKSAEHLVENEGVNQLAKQRRALVLLTDGAEESSYYTFAHLSLMLREKNIKVYVIGFPQVVRRFGPNREVYARAFLNNLAEKSGGHAYFPTAKAEEEKAAQEILAEIRNL